MSKYINYFLHQDECLFIHPDYNNLIENYLKNFIIKNKIKKNNFFR